MARKYSTFHGVPGASLRTLGIRTEDELVDRINSLLHHAPPLQSCAGDVGGGVRGGVTDILLRLHSVRLWNFHPAQHYFLHPGLAEFLLKSTAHVKAGALALLPDVPATKGRLYEPARALYRLSEEAIDSLKALETTPHWQPELGRASFGASAQQPLPSALFLHFPVMERSRSVMVIPRCAVWAGTEISGIPQIVPMVMYAMDGDAASAVTVFSKKDTELHGELSRLVAGFCLYIDAFPETVRTMRTPSEVGASPKLHRGASGYIAMNDIVKREMQHSRTPYWRGGYWRTLRSEFYTKKRGQSVWSEGGMVKGRAKEVLHPDECSADGLAQ